MGARVLGRGFVATLAGLEITNIIVYSRLGALYGAYGFIMVAAASIPVAYLQEIIVLPGRSLFTYMAGNRRVYAATLISIYLASLITLLVNVIGLSALLSHIYGVSWLPLSIILLATTWAIALSGHRRLLEKALTGLALGLGVYVAAYIAETGIRGFTLAGKPPGYYDTLLLWGAAAAPYSLVMQGDERGEGFTDVYAGLFSTIAVGVAVAGLSASLLYPSPDPGLLVVVKPFTMLHPVAMMLFLAGLVASVVLASVSIYVAGDEVLRRLGVPGAGHALLNISIAAVFATASYSLLTGDTGMELYTTIVLHGTAAIGVLMAPVLAGLTYVLLRHNIGGWINKAYMAAMTLFTAYLSVMAVLELA